MIETSRHQAIIDLLAHWENDNFPLDRLLAKWGKENRYAGAKDRQEIAALLYGIIRKLGVIDWWIKRTGLELPADDRHPIRLARARLIVYLYLVEDFGVSEFKNTWDGYRFSPYALGPSELRMLVEIGESGRGLYHDCQPKEFNYNLPNFIFQSLVKNYGEDSAIAIAVALDQEADVDLRVNRLKANVKGVVKALQTEHIATELMQYAQDGLRLKKRAAITSLDLFKKGWIEPQDESAQIAAMMVDAKPGMRIIDWCAGAGGKSLAIAVPMENKGRLIALDIDEARLLRSKERLRRAGVHVAECKILNDATKKWLKRQLKHKKHNELGNDKDDVALNESLPLAGKAGSAKHGFDRILVDAPCSGSGTWRRNPDQKWRVDQAAIDRLKVIQHDILNDAAQYVKIGGRLIYATCSLLAEENQEQVEQFLNAHPHYNLCPAIDIWRQFFTQSYPGLHEGYLQLTPNIVQSDGFFIAIMERVQ